MSIVVIRTDCIIESDNPFCFVVSIQTTSLVLKKKQKSNCSYRCYGGIGQHIASAVTVAGKTDMTVYPIDTSSDCTHQVKQPTQQLINIIVLYEE